MVTRIITLVLLIGAISLGYVLYSNVKGPVDEKVSIQRTEKQIERKLKYVRDVQALYLSQNGKYAGKWKDLEDFVLNGTILNVQQKEVTKLQDDGKEIITIEYDTLGTVPVKDSLAGQYADIAPRKMSIIPGTGKQFTLFAGKVDNGGVMLNVYEVRDEYPINPERGAQFNEKGEPYSVTSLIKYFEDKLKTNNEEARKLQEKLKKASGEEKKKIEEEINELSKYINLYGKRIEQLQTKPLRVGSRVEATTAGNWE